MTINLSRPANRRHPLNRGRLFWGLSLPTSSKSGRLKSLTSSYEAVFTAPLGRYRRPGGWGSIEFDGTNYAAIAGPPADIQALTSYSLSCWVRHTDTSTRCDFLSHWGPGPLNYHFMLISNLSGGKVDLYIANGVSVGASNYTFSAGEWIHVVGTYDGSTIRLYINGKLDKSTSASPSIITSATGEVRIGASYDSGSLCRMDDVGIYNRVLSDSEISLLYRESLTGYPALLNRIRSPIISFPSAASYTVTAGPGTYTLSGQAAATKRGLRLASALGTYTESGQAANLKAGRQLTPALGSFTLSGQAATTRIARLLTAALGTYTESGQAAGLLAARRLTAANATYTLTGQTASLLRALKVAGAVGGFTLNGQNATLSYSGSNPLLAAGAGGFTLSGQTANLLRALRLAANVGTVTESGQAANLKRGLRLVIGNGAYTLSGIDANLAKGLGLIAGVGSFAVTGQNASLLRTRRLVATLGTFTLTGHPVALDYSGATNYNVLLTIDGWSLALPLTIIGSELSQDIIVDYNRLGT